MLAVLRRVLIVCEDLKKTLEGCICIILCILINHGYGGGENKFSIDLRVCSRERIVPPPLPGNLTSVKVSSCSSTPTAAK